jgi:hypothetical protein
MKLYEDKKVTIYLKEYGSMEIATNTILQYTINKPYFVPAKYVYDAEVYLLSKYAWNRKFKNDLKKNVIPILRSKEFQDKLKEVI